MWLRINSVSYHKMESDFIELSRYRDNQNVAETTDILDSANIPYRLGATASHFDITTIGTGSTPEVIISVRREDYIAARSAMEDEYLKIKLPEDHYLLTSADDELADILGKPEEWSAFDVAHARKIARDRGIDDALIKRKKSERMEQLQRGKPVSKKLLIFGWISSVLGGLIGLGIAWSICFMKEKEPEGEFYTYDERSRELGRPMFKVACWMTAIILFLRIFAVQST